MSISTMMGWCACLDPEFVKRLLAILADSPRLEPADHLMLLKHIGGDFVTSSSNEETKEVSIAITHYKKKLLEFLDQKLLSLKSNPAC